MINIHNNEFFELFNFPDGSVGIKWNFFQKFRELGPNYDFLAQINSSNDLIKLLMITDGVKRLGCNIGVTIPLFPGGRNDRVTELGASLSIKVYADIINAQKYDYVKILDAHSDVTPALINNCYVLPVHYVIKHILDEGKYTGIIVPDGGATKRLDYYFPNKDDLRFIQCLKKRDVKTGKLSGFKVCDEVYNDDKLLIVDDCVDNGGTFIGIAEEIKKNAPQSIIDLYVTHATLPNGISHFAGKINQIYTTNSIRYNQPDGVRVFKYE